MTQLESGVFYEVWTPNEAPQAAAVLLDLLATLHNLMARVQCAFIERDRTLPLLLAIRIYCSLDFSSETKTMR